MECRKCWWKHVMACWKAPVKDPFPFGKASLMRVLRFVRSDFARRNRRKLGEEYGPSAMQNESAVMKMLGDSPTHMRIACISIRIAMKSKALTRTGAHSRKDDLTGGQRVSQIGFRTCRRWHHERSRPAKPAEVGACPVTRIKP